MLPELSDYHPTALSWTRQAATAAAAYAPPPPSKAHARASRA
eukprot:CAMPEP_0197630872 /NCGR_PEP_ID=MMETSP1338-20131121/8227_1 /TAXON_ID=43686 ORGANISM="Pelagodinium beii, Strain RCC1491" /NCGR_SAMPLE_ID=MMETSP1338 /ASSEMBLY_ACC=CAM_ASM_000754 /LENGTH=41 /DNA_ID= /DNA_START= /DNA_END= /DNA_ORIENTATION=